MYLSVIVNTVPNFGFKSVSMRNRKKINVRNYDSKIDINALNKTVCLLFRALCWTV